MRADLVSRYVEDLGCDLDKASVMAGEKFKDLEAMDNYLEPYGRVNGLVSPEERQAKKEESKRKHAETPGCVANWWFWRISSIHPSDKIFS